MKRARFVLIMYVYTSALQLEYGQYSWSMTMGFRTLFTMISSNVKLEAAPLVESGHVLILTPFSVPVNVKFLTVSPDTSSFGDLPRLPTLILT